MDEFELFPDEGADAGGARRSSTIQSVSVAAGFLNILARAGTDLPLAELARRSGAGRSTAHRYMQSLVKEGLARQDPETGHYDLGAAALSIGLSALKRIEPVEIAARAMKELTRSHPMGGGVAVWTERGPVLVRWYKSPYFALNPVSLGDILPVDNSACGLVFQAFLPQPAIDMARGFQPAAFRGSIAQAARLDEIRRDHWIELTSHLLAGVTGQAAPVFDAQGELACVITTIADFTRPHEPEERRALYDIALRLRAEIARPAENPA
ncbi:IclR family transcriptional regulator [Paracoccus aminophilus]|uniref:Transcriptional regulator, IclR family n=1 Tax=Paracoccus aminophilus JCM 7686 TaxID=1367847 RepID=S5YYT8_PARAH|nr:IclR family transcriptional regulator [Paracoccus aminophilus]AGT10386.1 transcriptional regulator, IclR family [Paracoccus aminophilus JCM 7686]